MRTLQLVLRPLALAGVVAAVQAQTINDTVAANACLEVVGVNCVTASGWSGTYENVRTYLKSHPTATQAQVVNDFLIPAVRANTGLQFGVIDNVYKAFGRTATSENEYVWQPQFDKTWRTYNDLVKLVKLTPSPALPVTPVAPAPTIDAAAQSAAVQMAFIKVFARQATQADISQAASSRIPPAQVESWVRAGLPRSSNEVARVVDTEFPLVIGRSPNATERSSLISLISSVWTGADDLTTYLSNNRARYGAPPAPPAGSTPFHDGQMFFGYNGIPLSQNILSSSGGYLVNTNGSNIVAQGGGNIVGQGGGNIVGQGGGNFVDPATGILMNANREPLVIQLLRAQGSGYLVNTNGSNIVAQGGGNIVAQGGGNLVGPSGGTIVGQGGGNALPLLKVASFSMYSANDISRLRSAVNQLAISPAQIGQAIGTNPAINNQYSLKSVGGTPAPYNPGQVNITGSTQWVQGQPLEVTWQVTQQPTGGVCTLGVKARLDSSVVPDHSVTFASGHMTLAARNYAAGTKVMLSLVDLCADKMISQQVPVTVKAASR